MGFSHRYIVLFKGSYSIGLNSSLSHNHKPQILITDNPRPLCVFSCDEGRGVCNVSARVKLHFCGAHSTISYHCLGLCLLSFMYFGCGPGETQGRVCLRGFRSCILSHDIPDRSPYIHTFCLFFPSLLPSFILSPRAAYHKITGCHKQIV